MVPPKKKAALLSLRWLLLLPIPALWCVLSYYGQLDFLENKLIDFRYRARGELDAPANIVYVDIDNEAIQAYRWPWNHSRFAQLLDALFDHGQVKAVAFDLVFSQNARADFGIKEQNEGRLAFGKAVRKHQAVVLAANYVPGPGVVQTMRQFPWVFDGFADPAKNDTPELAAFPIMGGTWGVPGLIDTYRGEARAAPFFADAPVGTFYPLALRLALIEWGLEPDAIKRFADHAEIRRPTGELVANVPLSRGQLVNATWFSHWDSPRNPRCSVADIGKYLPLLDSADSKQQAIGKEFFAQFHNAIVLVGPVDPLLQDLATTPFDDTPVPQVGFHGNLLKTFLSGIYLRRLPVAAEITITFGLTITFVLLALTGGARGIRYKVCALIVTAIYVGAAFGLFSSYHLVLPITAPIGATLMTGLGAITWQLVEEQKARSRIKGMFGTYVSPQLVDRMVESGETPQLGGHEDEITAYFSDIQAFSSFSEKLGSGPLVELMNEYLTACTDIVQEEGGTLDKYIGDAVVAMFGAPIALPDHAYRACVASQRVHRKLAELRAKWKSEGDKWPEIVWRMQSRIGLNSGLATIGNMGSRTRFNYTMMGDNVNLAARMESGAKAYGVYTMVAEATKLACEQHGGDRLVFRFLDKIVVKGRSIPVPVYEVVGLKEDVNEATRACLAAFGEGIALYQAQRWDEARAKFEASARLEPNRPGETPGVETNPSLVLIERCEELKAHPPGADWNGVYVMKTK